MNDRTFSVIGFGTQSEKIAVQLESEGIGYGWGVNTRLLLILIDSNDTDDFVVKLCCKAKEKKCHIVFLSPNPALSFTALQPAADGILINDNTQEVLSIIRTLKHVIYKYNLLSYDMNDVIHFLSTQQVEAITIQEHQFPGLSFSKVGKFEFPHSEESTFHHLTFINLCQQPDESFFEEIGSVLNNYDEDFSLNSMVYDAEADCSTFVIISITTTIQ